MLVTPAFAQEAAAQSGPGPLETLLPIVLIFVVFYFLLIRPQQKKMKQQREMLSAIRRGDRVVTSGGIIGMVVKIIDDNELQLEIAEGVRVRVMRAMIANVMSRGEPAQDARTTKAAPAPANEDTAAPSTGQEPPTGGSLPTVGRASPFKRLFGSKKD